MELELKRGGRTARVETLGGELVSYRDERGLEYIWGGDPAYRPPPAPPRPPPPPAAPIRPTGRGAIPCCFPLWGR